MSPRYRNSFVAQEPELDTRVSETAGPRPSHPQASAQPPSRPVLPESSTEQQPTACNNVKSRDSYHPDPTQEPPERGKTRTFARVDCRKYLCGLVGSRRSGRSERASPA